MSETASLDSVAQGESALSAAGRKARRNEKKRQLAVYVGAVTTIQSAFRGQKARAELKGYAAEERVASAAPTRPTTASIAQPEPDALLPRAKAAQGRTDAAAAATAASDAPTRASASAAKKPAVKASTSAASRRGADAQSEAAHIIVVVDDPQPARAPPSAPPSAADRATSAGAGAKKRSAAATSQAAPPPPTTSATSAAGASDGVAADAGAADGAADPAAPPVRRRTPNERAQAYVLAAAEAAPAGSRERLRTAAPIIASCWLGWCLVCALWFKAFMAVRALLKSAPVKFLYFAYGIVLCFFGGPFAVSFAAIEAFNAMGYRRLVGELAVCARAWDDVNAADAADEVKDADGDGVADVDSLSPSALLARKTANLVASVQEPARVQRAFGALLAAWYGALAVLAIQFARAVALAVGLARMSTPPLLWLLGKPLGRLLGPRYAQWGPTIVETILMGIATCLAWSLERGVSAYYSSMHGGLLAARSLMELLVEIGAHPKAPSALAAHLSRLSGPHGTAIDELLGYALAFAGFVTQLATGFVLVFPLNLLLFPLLFIEWGLTWQLTWLT